MHHSIKAHLVWSVPIQKAISPQDALRSASLSVTPENAPPLCFHVSAPPPVALLSALVCALLPGFTLSFPAHFSISSPGHDLEQEGSLSSLHLRSQPGVLWHREFRVACGSRHRCAWSQSQPVSGGGRGTQGYLLHMNLLELG